MESGKNFAKTETDVAPKILEEDGVLLTRFRPL
jgi:hypothetical protein